MTLRLVRGAAFLFLLVASCTGPAVGTEGADCPNDNNCIAPLRCIEGKCAKAPPDFDAGPPRDTGPRPDTGPLPDTGPDTGMPDTGDEDAGMVDMGPNCPVPPTLSAIQSQIFGANGQPDCNQGACHGQSAAGGIDLTLPLAALHAELLGATKDTAAPEANIVEPGQPDMSRLYVIMAEDDPIGNGDHMPPGQPVDACDLYSIRQWILDGALQN